LNETLRRGKGETGSVVKGVKRQCPACGAHFYDMGKRPVVCPRCKAEMDLNRLKPKPKPEPTPEPEAPRAKRPAPKWSGEQAAALDAVGRWLKGADRPVFRLFGYAGVGKTTLARHVAEHASGKAAFAAFTGKAALVLRSKGCAGASTIHSLIYTANEGADGAPQFEINKDGPASRAALIVIDECSMVDEALGRDLLSFGKPILVLGDPAQLPPVKGAGFFTEQEPDVMLTEIHRQARDNPIIRLSQTIREGGEPGFGDFGEARVIRRSEIDADMVTAADQVLVGLNKTRRAYNARIRELNGRSGLSPVAEDKLVCLRNDREKGLLNGGLWRVAEQRGMVRDYVKLSIRPEEETGAKPTQVAVHKAFFEGREADLPYPIRRESDEFDYGYALTVHKAQGSQWDSLVMFDESGAFREHRARWLYTGVTRAAKRLVLVR
jgi:exodeoxyribonuclease-5